MENARLEKTFYSSFFLKSTHKGCIIAKPHMERKEKGPQIDCR